MAYGLGVLGLIVVGGFVGYMALLNMEVLPRLALAPGWSLLADDGARLTSEDMRGKIVLYTFAPPGEEEGPRATRGVMRRVREELKETYTGGVPVRLVTLTLGAADTSALRRAARETRTDSVWTFAGADAQTLQTVVRDGFGTYYEAMPDGSFRYDPTFVIVDGMGIVRAVYRFGLPDASDLVRNLESIVREAQAATGPSRYAYEAAHLFSCYSVPRG